jgi:ketosteroid isomerase-like protein
LGAALSEELRQRVHLIWQAFAAGNMAYVSDALDDNIDFTSASPPGLLPSYGHRIGKKSVMDGLFALRDQFAIEKFAPVTILAERNEAAVIAFARLRDHESGQVMEVMIAHFLHFRNGRIVSYRAFMDTLDAARQLFQQEFSLPPAQH